MAKTEITKTDLVWPGKYNEDGTRKETPKLPEEIQNAVKTGAVPASPGYLFAKNLDNPGLMDVFRTILKTS